MKLQLLTSLTSKPIIDLCDTLPVNPKYTWEDLCGLRDPLTITIAAVHHDALEKAKYAHLTDIELATRIANGHIGSKANEPDGDAGFPYDIWIRNGQAYLGNDLLPLKYGIKNNNTKTIHVCVSGEYRYTDTMTSEDYNMLCVVLVSLLQMEELPNLKTIKGHRELWPSECPGIDMNQLRDDVLNIQKQLEYAASKNAQEAMAYNIAQTILWTYNTAKGLDQYGKPTVDELGKEWARQRLLLLEPVMREHGFLQ